MCYPGVQASTLSNSKEVLTTLFSGTMFESKVYTNFFGIPFIAMDYTGSVIPVIFVVYFASKCEKFFSRFVPDLVKFFFVPIVSDSSNRIFSYRACYNIWFSNYFYICNYD